MTETLTPQMLPYLQGSERAKIYLAFACLMEGGLDGAASLAVLAGKVRDDATAREARVDCLLAMMEPVLGEKTLGDALIEVLRVNDYAEAAALSLVGRTKKNAVSFLEKAAVFARMPKP